MPTQAEIEEYQADVDEVSALAVVAVAGLVLAAAEEENPGETLTASIPAALERYMAASASLAVDWYRGLARTSPRPVETTPGAPEPIVGPTDRVALLDAQDFDVRPADPPPREQVESSVRWAVYAPAPAEEVTPVQAPEEDWLEVEPPPRQSPVERPGSIPDEPARPDVDEEPLRARVTESGESTARARAVSPTGNDAPRARIIAAAAGAPEVEGLVDEADAEQLELIDRLTGPVQRYVNDAARDTLSENADREGMRWARHASANACAFCRMLATRLAVFTSEEAAAQVVGRGQDMTLSERRARAAGRTRRDRGRFMAGGRRTRGTRALGEKYHDNCHCIPVPVRAGDVYEPPPYVAEWDQQYIDATNETPGRGRYGAIHTRAVLAHMRASSRAQGGSGH